MGVYDLLSKKNKAMSIQDTADVISSAADSLSHIEVRKQGEPTPAGSQKVDADSVQKALEAWDKLQEDYKEAYKATIYYMDPAFHAKVAQIKERLRATKTYKDDNYFIDPKSWTFEKALRQELKDHIEATKEAIDYFTREDMKTHSEMVANAAEASARGVPVEVVEAEQAELKRKAKEERDKRKAAENK